MRVAKWGAGRGLGDTHGTPKKKYDFKGKNGLMGQEVSRVFHSNYSKDSLGEIRRGVETRRNRRGLGGVGIRSRCAVTKLMGSGGLTQ